MKIDLDKPLGDMPSPTPKQLGSVAFEAIWAAIKSWDVNVPEFYEGYCGANGSHVALILDALESAGVIAGDSLPSWWRQLCAQSGLDPEDRAAYEALLRSVEQH